MSPEGGPLPTGLPAAASPDVTPDVAQAGGDRACPSHDGIGNEAGMRKDWFWAPEESTRATSLTHTPRARSACPLGH